MLVKELINALSYCNPEAMIRLPQMEYGDRPEWFNIEANNNVLDEDECPVSWVNIIRIKEQTQNTTTKKLIKLFACIKNYFYICIRK
jgi:hypothetical protein